MNRQCNSCGGFCKKSGCELVALKPNVTHIDNKHCYTLDYVAGECTEEQDKRIKPVSGYMAGRAYNELCKMIGGRWPDCKIEEEAPEVHKFFMALFGV